MHSGKKWRSALWLNEIHSRNSVIPAKPLHIALFITQLTNICLANNTGVSPIKAVVYDINWAHSMTGLEICSANHPLVKSSRKGAKRTLARPVCPKELLSVSTRCRQLPNFMFQVVLFPLFVFSSYC